VWGYPLANIRPEIGMAAGCLRNTTVSTLVADEYLYGGFSIQLDGNYEGYVEVLEI